MANRPVGQFVKVICNESAPTSRGAERVGYASDRSECGSIARRVHTGEKRRRAEEQTSEPGPQYIEQVFSCQEEIWISRGAQPVGLPLSGNNYEHSRKR
jgi:hypothetical protein